MHDEYGQNDEMDKEIYEYFDFVNKNQIIGSFDELVKSPEIVAFLKSRNYPTELYEFIVCNFDRSIKTCEEAVKEGIFLRNAFYHPSIASKRAFLNVVKSQLKRNQTK